MTAGKFPEQLLYARASDDIINAGMIFTPQRLHGASLSSGFTVGE